MIAGTGTTTLKGTDGALFQYLGDAANAAHVARQADEYGAQLATDHPGRFGFFATLPDVKATVASAEHGLRELLADGVSCQ